MALLLSVGGLLLWLCFGWGGATAMAAPAGAEREAMASALRNWKPDVGAARKFARGRAGRVGFAVRDIRGRQWHWQGGTKVPLVSTFKVMLMVAYLRQPGVRGRGLNGKEKSLIRPMIRRSDDPAANELVGRVGEGPLRALARAAGMRSFSFDSSIWGMSQTTAIDQALFMRRLQRLVPKRHRKFALRQMRQIVPSQRWGIGAVKMPKGWKLHFKGGWGSGSGGANHQVAILRKGKRRIGVAITTSGNPSHAYGNQTLRGIARRLIRDLDIEEGRFVG